MRGTNQQKWDYYKRLIDFKIELFILEQAPYPTIFYEIVPNSTLYERPILKVVYYDKDANYNYYGKKPTKVHVELIKEWYENIDLMPENIRYLYDKYNGKSEKEINDSNRLTFNKDEAERISKSIKDKKEYEQHLLNNGHARCERCMKIVPEKEIISYKITSIATYGHVGRMGKFCSGTCASHEQFAHEG